MSVTAEDLKKGLDELKEQHKEAIKEVQKEVLEKSAEGVEAANKRLEEVEAAKGEMERQIAELQTQIKGSNNPGDKPLHFNDAMEKAIEENAEAIKNYTGKGKLEIGLKAVGDMSPSNFGGATYGNITTDFRQSVLPLLTEQIWMRSILPSGTTSQPTITYPRHIGGEGGAAPWTSGDKPEMDFDFDSQTVKAEWIAGYVKVPREMLDDVVWLQSFLRQHMLLSLYKAENNQILNGNGTSPQLKGIIPQASAYNGAFTIPVERIVDAGFGQITQAFGTANVVLLEPRDAVAIILNKASGSGEYDLPPGTVGFVNNRLSIAGMTVLPTQAITSGQFLVGDNRASQFITRMAPELLTFNQNEDDAKKNLIMLRIEERVALATYYPQWWVKGSLEATT